MGAWNAHWQPRRRAVKKGAGSSMSGAGVFSRSCLPVGRRGSFFTARLPRHWPFRPATVPLPRSKASWIEGEGPRWSWEWKSHELFLCDKSAAVEKGVPSMGAFRAAPTSLGRSAQNLGSKSPLPRPGWAVFVPLTRESRATNERASYHSPPSLPPFTTGKATRAHPALAAF